MQLLFTRCESKLNRYDAAVCSRARYASLHTEALRHKLCARLTSTLLLHAALVIKIQDAGSKDDIKVPLRVLRDEIGRAFFAGYALASHTWSSLQSNKLCSLSSGRWNTFVKSGCSIYL